MIQQSFLVDMAGYGASRMKNEVVVGITVSGAPTTINVPCTITNESNNINVSFIIDNTVQGTLNSLTLKDADDNPVEIVELNYPKSLGTIFVGAFKFTYREGART